MKGPTKKQQEILLFISSFISEYGFAPSLREIAERFKVSPSAVHYALTSMEKKGLIEKNNGGARAIILPEKLYWLMKKSKKRNKKRQKQYSYSFLFF